MKTYILGISAYYHDSAAALICDGEIIAAAQEERFTRIKADAGFPHNAVAYCLKEAGINIEEADHIIFYEDPSVKFERILLTQHLTAPRSIISYLAAMPKWLTKNLWLESEICKELGIKKKIEICDHHMSHAASAFYPSPFEEAAILTIDGVGEWSTSVLGKGEGKTISLTHEMRFPNSLGLLYSAFTYYAGFKINSGEYKLMGLAPYGVPRFADLIKKHIVKIFADGSIIINQKYFSYTHGLRTINRSFEALFGRPARAPESQITRHDMDIAASIQAVTNEIILRLAKRAKAETGSGNLVLAGGVALNVVSMGHLTRCAGFDNVWVQPASGDAGGALGAALWFWHMKLLKERIPNPDDSLKGAFLGPEIQPESPADDEILLKMGGVWEKIDERKLTERIAVLLSENNVVGIARGRMEWGPRALGSRSILGSSQDVIMQSHINLKIKFRESFRPFAPMVLAEDAAAYFDMDQPESPYMLFTYYVKAHRRLKSKPQTGDDMLVTINEPRSDIPAITHLDYSARVQTVDPKRHPFIYRVINAFKEITGCSVIVNTSFNVRGEPIVNTAEDAYRCFMATDMDYVVIGNRLFDKKQQKNRALNDEDRAAWLRRFELD